MLGTSDSRSGGSGGGASAEAPAPVRPGGARSLGARLGLVLVSGALSLVLVELGLQWRFRGEESARLQHHQLFCEYDALLGWRKIPNARGRHTTEEYDVLEVMNSRGIRGPEYPYEKPPDQYRVLILGDSFAEGYTVRFEELFSELVEGRLRGDLARDVEVINTGTGGWSTDQQLLFFEAEGRKYQPNLTVVVFSINDVWYNDQSRYWRGAKPRFELRAGELVLTNVPVPLPVDDASSPYAGLSFVERTRLWLSEESELYSRLGLVRDRLWPESSGAGDPVAGREARLGVYRREESAAIRGAWSLTEALLRRLAAATARAGSALLVFYVPPRPAVYQTDWSRILSFMGASAADWDVSRPRDRLAAICARQGIPFADPTGDFRDRASRGREERLYFHRDPHWTRAGHEVAGESLARAIGRAPDRD